jgi:hypothetical protein
MERAARITARRLWWTGQLTVAQYKLITSGQAFETFVDQCHDITPQALQEDGGEGDGPFFRLLQFLWTNREAILEFILDLVKLFGGS